MKNVFASSTICCSAIFALVLAGGTLSPVAIAEDGATATADAGSVVELFDGKGLSGWAGRDDLWSVEDGQIVGRTTDEDPIGGNTFLVYEAEKFDNFELTAEFKIESGNSGIQYRSRVVDPAEFVVSGYQADIDHGNKFAGILYEEKARGILALRGEKVTIGADGKKAKESFGDAVKLGQGIHPGQWNDFRVVADENHLQHFINGTLTSEVIDQQSDKAAKSGIIALQLHKGPAMTVRFKNLKIRKL
ncbi:hypothetical protein K227x_61240 [Rubripirellula lacrimiformis]|uniref:3-keto-alpha-glucoside-1,2-lyase/3-keto-2-hydroxy-glucal hydratase domain-containing protein n=1 Tax=Rubripirellula lacrimiformis TaxID=1930273 RepID=A0A517NKP1_9BACT|nr:DUF1080 domain-containing protein [Rubripirellula lacrimiformis]QDT07696.1 hypothetical protein K227x_61240 [Rubripirellula lacrimiformis]